MRRGITPIIGAVAMVAIILGIAGTTVVYLQQTQKQVAPGDDPELETINITCSPAAITWWIENTGEVDVEQSRADLLVYDEAGLQTGLSTTNVPVSAPFLTAGRNGSITLTPGNPLTAGNSYDMELDFTSVTVSASCRVGGQWWDINWDYRRALTAATGSPVTANITLDAENLTRDGKIRSDCTDVRPVNDGNVTFYTVSKCDPDGEAWILANVSDITVGDTYIYYGNLQAGSAATGITQGTMHDATLGPEEQIRGIS